MANLWKETIAVLEANGKNWNDVIQIGGKSFYISKDNYEEVALMTNYDNGYGAAEIARDLELVGSDFKLIRSEYDGSEWFDFISFAPAAKKETIWVERLKIRDDQFGWESLKSINTEEEW